MSKQGIITGFAQRHIGTSDPGELKQMLSVLKADSLDQLIAETIPDDIRLTQPFNIPDALTEQEYLRHMRSVAAQNNVFRSYIGLGYYGTHTPSPIKRNIFENPGWYTQYTPYQAEISQGRLEALLNFQTVVSDLTGLPIANASLLDEGTAAAEAMTMLFNLSSKKSKNGSSAPTKFFVDQHIFPQTLAVLHSRAEPIGITLVSGDWNEWKGGDDFFGAILQYPDGVGAVHNYQDKVKEWQTDHIKVAVVSDLLALTLLSPPGHWGADVVVGNSQRFGVPVGYGGPHAAFFATKEEYKRNIPGRIIGVSVDRYGNRALRMALQTREQHIKREKATSNICTAQALLAIIAGMYAVYHGPEQLKKIAQQVHNNTAAIYRHLVSIGLTPQHDSFFDTLSIPVSGDQKNKIKVEAEKRKINFHYTAGDIRLSLDETVSKEDLNDICATFSAALGKSISAETLVADAMMFPDQLLRDDNYLSHSIFSSYRTETELMRYIKSLENKDLSLTHAMIPLGSCTMKLNAASEMYPVSWPEFSTLHPFVPGEQAKGYKLVFDELADYLCEITGMKACSLQPNSGAQGELAGLLTIRAYHAAKNDHHRNIALIPQSAHGTNPASAVMAGMDVVVVKCDERGNIDMTDLNMQAEKYADRLAAAMVTYPSTHGVFETTIKELCNVIHKHGGLVYLDGANMNAQVGLTSPGFIGADVCHLNLHKTFAIPHGGGGPGMGPICVNEKLAPYLPGHPLSKVGGSNAIDAVSSAPWGSASVLLISYGYIRMLGRDGLTQSTIHAILASNYIKSRLENYYEILYTGEAGRTAHELIIDLRPFKQSGVSAEDVAKRLIDFGFHAPTLSFPVPGTIMIEPTESESKSELDLFCDAMIQIHREIDQVIAGLQPADNNVLSNAPHTLNVITADEWILPYSRSEAAYPLPMLRHRHKFWASVARVDNAYGDRNLICICPPIEAYATPEPVAS
ncbi:MAG TPA: aminomethyl-transferring glycine dehydrogenase [Saprospiraceae bacterium]|nr:aminomethyl-transferring glycine dehydrogenase [Saprospiraceae bacterium]